MKNDETIDKYIRCLEKDIPAKLNKDSIFNLTDIDYLEKLYSRFSSNGDLHDWSMSIGNGAPMASIRKYIDFLGVQNNR